MADRSDTASSVRTPLENAGHGSHADLVRDHAATMLPQELLQSGETIILLLKPSPWYILLQSLGFIAGTAVLVVLLIMLWRSGYSMWGIGKRDIVVLGLAAIGARLFWQFLEWLSRIYVLTDRRVIRIRGVIRVHVFETRLQQIQHTTLFFSLRERIFGLGTLGFATAGTALTEAYWQMLAHPMEVQRVVIETINRYR